MFESRKRHHHLLHARRSSGLLLQAIVFLDLFCMCGAVRDIFELRRVYPDIPNSQLQELILLNKATYPQSFIKGN